LFYYARPGIPRNGFELAMTTLRRVKRRLGPGIDIVCAGAEWRPADFGLSDIVINLGLLPYAETGELYRSCHMGLAMMMTRHPSYLPLELMACGSLVVVNDNPANRWLLRDHDNCLMSPSSAGCLTQTLVRAAEDYPALSEIRARAEREIEIRHSDWDATLDSIWEFMRMPSPSTDETARPARRGRSSAATNTNDV
jgi:glycosyltransferase involved in cell wall biosynthesis